MKLAWTKEIEDSNFTPFDHECRAFVFGNKLFYAYSCIDPENQNSKGGYGAIVKVLEVNLSDLSSSVKRRSFTNTELKNKEVLMSGKWRFLLSGNNLHLYVGFLLDVSTTEIPIADIDYAGEEFKVKTEYDFGDKYLQYNGRSVIACFDKASNTEIWKVKIKGYIYTDIELKDQYLFLGTAGNGGGFYCIDLNTGQVLTELVNSNASNYAWQNNEVILMDKNRNLQLINPYTGAVLYTLVLKDKLTGAPILADNQHFYTVTSNQQTGSAQLICVRNDSK